MRAMILAAGLGTRMRSLSPLCAKPALPVRGVPVIGHLMHRVAEWGVDQLIVNLHHRAETVREAVATWRPPGLEVEFSVEEELLGTGGGIARAAEFLEGSDPCLVLPGDMLVDLDFGALLDAHERSGRRATLALLDDPRADSFGSLGIDDDGTLRRIGTTVDWGGETRRGLFLGVRLFSPEIIGWHREARAAGKTSFEDLRDVLAPRIETQGNDAGIGGVLLDSRSAAWQPVGTPQEYLDANFTSDSRWQRYDARARELGTRIEPGWIAGAEAEIAPDARLERVVVWPHERVAAGTDARDGVIAGGQFHPREAAPSRGNAS